MKKKKTGRLLLAFSLVVLIFIFSAFNAFAVPDDEGVGDDEVYQETEMTVEPTYETQEPETYAPETEAPTYETQAPETQPPETEAPETYAPETEAPTETYAVLDNNLDDLPEADTAPHPTAPRTKKAKQKADLTYGIISWACVIVGVLTVIIVILSNKSGYYGGSGKQRYDEGNKMTGQRRLLNDDYYTERKYNRYQDRDSYR